MNGASLPVCIVQEMNSDLAGVVNPAMGNTLASVDLSTRVYLGETQTRPCPVCTDAGLNDGIRNGVCMGGPRDGEACDSNASHCTYGNVSYECPPPPLANVTGAGLQIDFDPLTSGLVSMDPDDCGGAGNSCVGACVFDTPPFEHECDGSDLPTAYCDGAQTCNAEGYVTCAIDADCTALDSQCPNGDCGDCTLLAQRDCVSNPFEASGSTGSFYGDLASVFCVPTPTASAGVNAAYGFPGPGRLKLDVSREPKCGRCTTSSAVCDSDADCGVNGPCVATATPWNPPNGSVCHCNPAQSRFLHSGRNIPGGQPDAAWQVFDSTGADLGAAMVLDPDPYPAANMDPARWITCPASNCGLGDYTYRRCWRLCDAPGQLSVSVLADDNATILLNDVVIGQTPPNGSVTPAGPFVVNNPASFNVPGTNCLDVVVTNVGGGSAVQISGFATTQ
jgi:hypothetical protein